MTWNNREIIAEMRGYISRWRSRCCRRHPYSTSTVHILPTDLIKRDAAEKAKTIFLCNFSCASGRKQFRAFLHRREPSQKKNTTHKHSNFNFPRSKVRLLLQSTPIFTEFPQVSISFSTYEVIGSTPCSAYSVFSNFLQTSIRILLIECRRFDF